MKQHGYMAFGPGRDERRTLAELTLANARHHVQVAHVTTSACAPVDVNHASPPAPVGLSIRAATTAGGMVMYDRTLPWPLQSENLSSLVSTMGDSAAAVSDPVSLLSVKAGNGTGTASLATESMTVTTDKADYTPGSTATFTVAGVNSGSSVAFQIGDLASDPHMGIFESMGENHSRMRITPVPFRYPRSRAQLHDLVVSSPDQPHIRSPLATAAPISRLRRSGLRRTRPFWHTDFQAMGLHGSSTWIRQD